MVPEIIAQVEASRDSKMGRDTERRDLPGYMPSGLNLMDTKVARDVSTPSLGSLEPLSKS